VNKIDNRPPAISSEAYAALRPGDTIHKRKCGTAFIVVEGSLDGLRSVWAKPVRPTNGFMLGWPYPLWRMIIASPGPEGEYDLLHRPRRVMLVDPDPDDIDADDEPMQVRPVKQPRIKLVE
jgi:hypothetical protein